MSLLLEVPWEEKEEVKALGAKWDSDLSLWHLDEKYADKVSKEKWFVYCSKHKDKKAVSICQSCGNFMCDACDFEYNHKLRLDEIDKMCEELEKNIENNLKKDMESLIFEQKCYDVVIQQCVFLAIGIALFFASFFLLETNFVQNIYKYHSIFDRTIISILFAGMPFGWNFLDKYTSKSKVYFSAISWCFYFVLKLILSWIIGIFVLIVNLAKTTKKAIKQLISEKKITLYHLIFD